jgi:murein DD-endopeptidase MepM/ murein hydrolase activator NlpD
MTESPSPSGRPGTVFGAALALFRPVLFGIGAFGLALAALVLTNRANQPTIPFETSLTELPRPPAPAQPPQLPPAEVVLPAPEPLPPLSSTDFTGFQMKPPEPATEPEPPASDRYELTLRLERGDTVNRMLADIEVPEADRKQIEERLQSLLKKRKLATGEEINLIIQTLPDQPDAPRVLSLSVRPQPEREYIIERSEDGTYRGEEKVYKVGPRIVRVDTEITASFHQSGVKAGAPAAAMNDFIKALSYDVDFQRELKVGQRFTVLLEQLVTSDGKVTHPGRMLAGELRLLKRSVTVIRYRPQGGADQFYSPQGESVLRTFLRTPMDVSKVTSRFGMREHPILGFSALHAGVDFGAPMGTPVLAAGAGKVKMAGPNGGYGTYVKLEHTAQVGTAYAHLSRLGPGIKPGATVRQGQVIGFVGSTGMSTGPHLHYEFHRGGKPVNPLAQKFAMRAALGGKDLATFQGMTRQYLAQLKNAPKVADVASPTKPRAKADASQLARGE